MENYSEYDPNVKMELEKGFYTAKVASVKRPSGNESFPAPDMALIWSVTEGIYHGLQAKQSFRTTGGDAEQNDKGIRKLNKTIETLFGINKGKISDLEYLEKEAVIYVREYAMSDRSGTYVHSISLNDNKIIKLGPSAQNQASDDLNDEMPF